MPTQKLQYSRAHEDVLMNTSCKSSHLSQELFRIFKSIHVFLFTGWWEKENKVK